ncbi:MAG: tetratricopeptide repeat protein [Thermoanaerobaculia bacterium]
MRPTPLVLLTMSLAGASLATAGEPKPPSAEQLLDEGVHLYDSGNFEGALKKHRAALDLKPGDPTITYEVGLSLQALKRYAECATLTEPMIAKVERLKRDFYVLAASCIDTAGDPKRAGALFDAALRDFPDDPQLHFNAGVTRLGGKEPRLARELLKDSVLLRPTHPASHLYLGMAFEQTGFTVPAILTLVRFLTLAPADSRAPAAALAIGRLLGLGVEVKSDGGTNLQFDPEASTEEGDYRQADLMRVMAAAVGTTDENRDKNDVEKYRDALGALVRFLGEETPPAKPDFARAKFLPVALELEKVELLEAFVYRSLRPLSEEQTKVWLDAHPEKILALDAFVETHGGASPRK